MAKVILKPSSALVPRQDRNSIRKFHCAVFGGESTKADPERDFIRLGEAFDIAFLTLHSPLMQINQRVNLARR